jgi:hypothetical protein
MSASQDMALTRRLEKSINGNSDAASVHIRLRGAAEQGTIFWFARIYEAPSSLEDESRITAFGPIVLPYFWYGYGPPKRLRGLPQT